MGLLRGSGRRTAKLRRALRRRERTSRDRRAALDARVQEALARRRAIVYTDTADFTRRAARDGILHFMMVFDRAVRSLRQAAARHRGRIVKVEADSLLLSFPDAERACLGVGAMERALRQVNRGRLADERLRFSYGIGCGDVLDLEEDLFGLEVNLASKLGEDRARPGEALLTPAAAETLPLARRRRLAPHGVVDYGGKPMTVRRLRLGH
jgi:class 3 adenylate cyclase